MAPLPRAWNLLLALLFAVVLGAAPTALAQQQDDTTAIAPEGAENITPIPTPTYAEATQPVINPYTTGTSRATVVPSIGDYTYAGCYNESMEMEDGGRLRALSGPGAKMEGNDALTPSSCFAFCGGLQYAGLQYARECWCAPSLSSQAQRIDESWCNRPCAGDESAWCGGRWTLTLYNRTAVVEEESASYVTITKGFLSIGSGLAVLIGVLTML